MPLVVMVATWMRLK